MTIITEIHCERQELYTRAYSVEPDKDQIFAKEYIVFSLATDEGKTVFYLTPEQFEKIRTIELEEETV